jgi:hypothetical protein
MATETITIPSACEGRLPAGTVDSEAPQYSVEPRCSVPDEAKRILIDCLLKNSSLGISSQVSEGASAVVFTPEVKAFMPTPMKMTESVSALWACIGLFASAICQERYNASKPTRIEVDVHSATLMLMSLALFEIDGLGDGDAARRVEHIDKGRISETYRAMATNMYEESLVSRRVSC